MCFSTTENARESVQTYKEVENWHDFEGWAPASSLLLAGTNGRGVFETPKLGSQAYPSS